MGNRRVITGERDGKSVVLTDLTTTAVESNALPEVLWRGDPIPPVPNDGTFDRELRFPAPGGVWLARWVLEPGAQANEDSGAVNASDSGSNFHRTDSIDINVILSGSVVLELDDGAEVELGAGDVVVLNGNGHAWHNRGDQPAEVAITIVGANRHQPSTTQ